MRKGTELGIPETELLYSVKEIAAATGLKEHQVHTRRKALEMTSCRQGYTYEQVRKIMLYKPTTAGMRPRPAMIDKLKEKLKTDGLI